MAKKNRDFWQSARMNNMTFVQYYNRLVEIAINMFEWRNLPDSIDPRFLELILFSDGFCVFFKDEFLGYLTLQVMTGGKLNVYRIPTERRAYATNGYNMNLNENNSVIIYNNYTHTNSLLEAEMYALRMYEIERAIDVNVKQQKTPKIVTCSENQRLVITNLMMKYDGNQPFIFGDKDLDLNTLKSLDTTSPFVADKLQILKRQVWNEALTYFGVENSNTEKKERLVTDEIDSNLGGVEAQRYVRLNARKDACKQINKMFPELGGKIDVVFRERKLNKEPEDSEEEVKENE